ncbi:MAG TPA: RDD family protein, partial [Yinghuangia sp.]|nr:RDD family protein [Yinghuangia sp.]
MGWGGRFDLGNYRSEPPGSVGSRVTARVIDAVVLVFLLAGAWIALVGQLRTQTYRLPREMFAEAFAGAAAEGTSGVQAGAARAVDGAVQETTDMLAVVLVLHIVVPVVYELAFQLMLGRTPGKLVCGLRVVPATGYDDRAGVVRGAVRAPVLMGAPR